jgi:hypothetical protein
MSVTCVTEQQCGVLEAAGKLMLARDGSCQQREHQHTGNKSEPESIHCPYTVYTLWTHLEETVAWLCDAAGEVACLVHI